ncbi:MAG: DUF1963 domain-containing protein [Parahaliea sp.]
MNKDELIAQIGDYFPPEVMELVTAAMVSSIAFVPLAGDSGPGATRFGGVPDLPPAIVWPYHQDIDIARLEAMAGRSHREHIRSHAGAPLPLSFVAQIDLAEARGLGSIASDLPGQGRLLFFYDYALGPWDDGPGVARVIWDQSEPAQLRAAVLPARLQALDSGARAAYAAEIARHGWEVEEDYNPGYIAPAVPMQLVEDWSLLSASAVESTGMAVLENTLVTEPGDSETQISLYDLYIDFYPEDPNPVEQAFGYLGHRLLGYPEPEQDDPRYGPAFEDFLDGRAEDDRLRQVFFDQQRQRAADWRLLLQVDIARWLQTGTEGTVYFLIRREDLRARRFDRVWAVYQQT